MKGRLALLSLLVLAATVNLPGCSLDRRGSVRLGPPHLGSGLCFTKFATGEDPRTGVIAFDPGAAVAGRGIFDDDEFVFTGYDYPPNGIQFYPVRGVGLGGAGLREAETLPGGREVYNVLAINWWLREAGQLVAMLRRCADTVGVYDPTGGDAGRGSFSLWNAHLGMMPGETFASQPSGIPVAGDWLDRGGPDVAGLYHPGTGRFILNAGAPLPVEFSFPLPAGVAPDTLEPVAGNWDGTGEDTVGLFDPATLTFYYVNDLAELAALSFRVDTVGTLCAADWLPVAGDWDGDRIDSLSLYCPDTGTASSLFLRSDELDGSSFAPVDLDLRTRFVPIAGDWDADGVDGVGLYRPGNGVFRFYNLLVDGRRPEFRFESMTPGGVPVAGNWDGR